MSAYRDDGDDGGEVECHSLFTFVTQVLVEFSEQLNLRQVPESQAAWAPISARELAYQTHLPGCENLLSCVIYLSAVSLSCKMSLRIVVKAVAKSK